MSVHGPEEGLYHSPSITGPHFLLLRRGSFCMLALWGFSYRPPTPKRLTLFSQIPAPRFTARPLAGPPSDLQAQSAPQLSLCWYQVLPEREPPAPHGVVLSSPTAAGSAVRCKPADPQRAALTEAGSWRGGDLRTSLPGRKSETLNSRIRDRRFALLTLRNL